MPSYKLIYFDVRGLAEVSRFLFYLSSTPFQDYEVSDAEWLTLQGKTPYGKLPILEVDGKTLAQSFAIARYLAREFGFAGNSPFECALVDALGDQFKDYWGELFPYFATCAGIKEFGNSNILRREVGEPARDKFFTMLERVAKENGSNGHLVGDSLTWIDLTIADHITTLNNFSDGFVDDRFPAVLAVREKVMNDPRLTEYLAKRPKRYF
ncbi:hypothetical protein PFISCL1PPCAC_12903 [Pristionchus fissidentatus]|uniref:glutathione transferase n=1 Tax=Pristionchus fissidentatus TaxID=1538716 RepID=A0AAV5VSR8_9BILA|nr:hypothetical protein PFISCL1PPCAC_12903 [Pristionchus fissidentatus]